MRFRAIMLVPALSLLGLLRPAASAATVDRGTIGGAAYAIARPAAWGGRLLLIAPDYRPTGLPLRAELQEGRPLVRSLLAQGWMVATTSYRRNGLIVRDAIADLAALRSHIVTHYREPVRTYLLGESMGGLIVTLAAEQEPDLLAGAVAVGAALEMREPAPTIGLEMRPQRPVLFLSNRSEIGGPERYVAATRTAGVPSVLWRVERDGRANINTVERLAALSALAAWAETGVRPPDNHPAMLEPAAQPSRVAFHPDGSALGRVTEVQPVSGNLTVDFQPADLEQLGIARGTWFALVLPPLEPDGPERVLRALHGANFAAVRPGAWVGFPEAEGWFILAVNRGNAAEVARLRVGDAVRIRRLGPGN